ncbi:hypothetical protein ACJMK2_037374 [Sinanodonta woodiana]|uniref:Uncharacterized protein n=1 Tax=Sinanodonta woodiana TaxID=1069815 RepID=A0ABD3WLZ9_SINWO
MSKENNPLYFGNWTLEYAINGIRDLQIRDINSEVYDSATETVIDVSERGKWEQDWMFVRIPRIPQAKEIFIRFAGMSWRNLSLQAPNITWHLQAVVTPNQRIDTGKPNNSPQAFSKPMYRIPLGQEKHIQITTLDPDGDFVKCALSKNQEAYLLATIKLPDVTVTEDCIIKIPAYRSLGYQNGTFGGIAVTIRDYKEQLQFSSIGLQFLVQFLEVINEPKLIYKTPDDRHRFNVYYGTTWQIDLFAEAVTPAIIDHFSYVRRQENLTFTEMKNVSVPDYKNVTMATLTWSPLQSDVGEHIVCVNVEDSVG